MGDDKFFKWWFIFCAALAFSLIAFGVWVVLEILDHFEVIG